MALTKVTGAIIAPFSIEANNLANGVIGGVSIRSRNHRQSKHN